MAQDKQSTVSHGAQQGIHKTKYWENALGESLEPELVVVDDIDQVTEDAALSREDATFAAKEDLNFLAAIAMPVIFKFDFPSVHLAIWQMLTESTTSATSLFPKIALGIPRGHAKTTLIKLYILWCILFSRKRFILVIASTSQNAENIIADVADMLSESNIAALFGDWTAAREINRQDLKKFFFRGREIILGAIGAGGSIRGLNIKNARPDIMVFEDVQTKEDSVSAVISDALEQWMIGTAMKAKSPTGCVYIFVGNMYPGPNSILKKLTSNSQWIKFVSGAILSTGKPLWPELHSLKSLVEELDNDIAMGHPEIFFSEVLNDTEAGINNRTDLSKIRPWKWTDTDFPQGKFILIDPSANKKGGDAVSIGYFEVYDETPALRKLYIENMSPGNTIRHAILMALQTNTRLLVVEATSYQYTFLYWFNEVCREIGITGLECVDIYTGNYSKNARITDMLKALTAGEIIIHPDVVSQVTNEIVNWNPMKRDNTDGILDLLAYAPRTVELYSSSMITDGNMLMIEAEAADVDEVNSPF